MTNFDLVKKMHHNFKIEHDSHARALSKEEYLFRIGAMAEELFEYINSVFEIPPLYELSGADKSRESLVELLSEFRLHNHVGTPKMLEKQFDAVIDLVVFAMGTAERQGFEFDEGFKRVMDCNLQKELAKSSIKSKRGFSLDLIKPEGWKPPSLIDLVLPPTGIIVLEGPDGTGKTSIAKMLVEKYGAMYIHHTWSPELEEQMEEYHMSSILKAKKDSLSRLVVIDRSWISEFIYADVFRQGTQYPNLAEKAYKELKDANAIYIFCLPYGNDSIEKYFKEYEILRTNRTEMYESMRECFLAYYSFVIEGGYFLNNKENKCNFLGKAWPMHEGASTYLPSLVFDRFKDSDYSKLLKRLNAHLSLNKLDCF
jgi:predicted HAD superfamily Cof-like phosphohydrolase